MIMPLMKGPVKLCLVVSLVVPPMTALAFGSDGHLIVGYVADKYLCAATRRAIKPLMGGYSLGDIGIWADRIRSDPDWYQASSWHYLNVGDRQSIARRRRPPRGDVLTALDKFQRQLQDKSLDAQMRAQALRFVVHFVADVHQPLHVGWIMKLVPDIAPFRRLVYHYLYSACTFVFNSAAFDFHEFNPKFALFSCKL